jgi:hypothetical protein
MKPVRLVAEQLRIILQPTIMWFWVVVVAAWLCLNALLWLIAEPTTFAWRWFVAAPPKYFLLVLAIITVAAYLPNFIAHGITRRHFAFGWATFFGTAAVAFGFVALVGHALEYLLYRVTGRFLGPMSYLVDTPGAAAGAFGTIVLQTLAWSCTGALIGAGFYRFGTWGGILFIPVGSVPGIITEAALNRDPWVVELTEAVGLRVSGWAVAGTVGPVLVVLGLAGLYRVLCDVPIRKVSG